MKRESKRASNEMVEILALWWRMKIGKACLVCRMESSSFLWCLESVFVGNLEYVVLDSHQRWDLRHKTIHTVVISWLCPWRHGDGTFSLTDTGYLANDFSFNGIGESRRWCVSHSRPWNRDYNIHLETRSLCRLPLDLSEERRFTILYRN